MSVSFAHPPAYVEWVDRGVGESAFALRLAVIDASVSPTFTQREWREQVQQAIAKVAAECADPGWDGYDALPVLGSTFEYATALARLLEGRVPQPDVTAHPDGELSFEWYQAPRRTFIVAVGPDGTMTYFGVFGVDTSKGQEMLRDALPRPILDGIRRVMSHE